MSSILLVDWNSEFAQSIQNALQQLGHSFKVFDSRDKSIIEDLKTSPPQAAIIDLRRLPSHGRDVAIWLRQQKATRSMALIFVEGDAQKN